MSFEQQMHLWSWVVAIAACASLAVPVVQSFVRRGTIPRKCVYVAATLLVSWLVPVVIWVAVGFASAFGEYWLVRESMSSPAPSQLLELIRSLAGTVNKYWFIAGPFAIPVAAALLSILASPVLVRKLLPLRPSGQPS